MIERSILEDRYCSLNHDIRICERKLDMVDSRIKRLTMKKSPARNMGLILPLTISMSMLVFGEIANRYTYSIVERANANGIYNVDLGIFDNVFISWLLFSLLPDHTVLFFLVITSVYCFTRLFGRYGYTKTGILPSKIANFFGDINYNIELSKAHKEYCQMRKELAELRIEKESIESQFKE